MLQTKFLFPKNLQDISSSNETECVNKGKGGGGFRVARPRHKLANPRWWLDPGREQIGLTYDHKNQSAHPLGTKGEQWERVGNASSRRHACKKMERACLVLMAQDSPPPSHELSGAMLGVTRSMSGSPDRV